MKAVLSLALVSVVVLSAATVRADPPSKYRKIQNGYGNCIFSNKMMPPHEEASWDVRGEFSAPDPVWGRCYYPGPLKGFEAKGRLSNSLRDDKVYYNDITISSGRENTRRQYLKPLTYTEKQHDADTGMVPLDPSVSPCFVVDPTIEGGCVNVADVAKAIAHDDGKALPITVEVCYRVYFEVADQTVSVFDKERNAVVTKDDRVQVVLANGCAKYTVK